MTTLHDHALESEGLEPAYSLIFDGLDADANLEQLIGPLSKLLGLAPAQARQAIAQPPLYLLQSRQAAQLDQHRQLLARGGCRASIEAVWRYRHWTLPRELLQRLEDLPRRGKTVFGLLHVSPAPGITGLERAARAVSSEAAYALNHGQILLQMSGNEFAGAARWLQHARSCFEEALQDWSGGAGQRVFSTLAICPEEADGPAALLDLLEARLKRGKPEQAPVDSEFLEQLQARPLSGRAWARLVEQGLRPQPDDGFSAGQIRELEGAWPAGRAPESLSLDDGRQRKLARIVEQYQTGAERRLQRAAELVRHFDEWDHLPSLPGAVMQAHELAQSPDGDADELARVVCGDPALSARILSLVNSAYYGLRQKVDSIAHAVVILGFDEVAELALLMGSESLFEAIGAERGRRLWRHSAMTADLARALATRLELERPTLFFTAALLHDVGKVVLHALYPHDMEQLERIARANNLPLYEMERERFLHDHATLGAALMRRWRLPESLCALVEQHHGPLPGQLQSDPGAAVIGLADDLSHRLSQGEPWADAMRLRRVQLDALQDLVDEELNPEGLDRLLGPKQPATRAEQL